MKRLTTALMLAAAPVAAQEQPAALLPLFECGDTKEMFKQLKEKFNEANAFIGAGDPRLMDTLWINEETGSYTIVRSNVQDGVSCVVLKGIAGQLSKPKNVVPKVPS
jgi:hypothetical protein